jgi:hypothetical protein
MSNSGFAIVIDEIRRQYASGTLDRSSAILHIRSQMDLTEVGAADLLDDPREARDRYAAMDEV